MAHNRSPWYGPGILEKKCREATIAFKRKRAGLSVKTKKPLLGAKSGSSTNKSSLDRARKQVEHDNRKEAIEKYREEKKKVAQRNFKAKQRENNAARDKDKAKRQAYLKNDTEKTRRNYSNRNINAAKVRNLRGNWGRKPA